MDLRRVGTQTALQSNSIITTNHHTQRDKGTVPSSHCCIHLSQPWSCWRSHKTFIESLTQEGSLVTLCVCVCVSELECTGNSFLGESYYDLTYWRSACVCLCLQHVYKAGTICLSYVTQLIWEKETNTTEAMQMFCHCIRFSCLCSMTIILSPLFSSPHFSLPALLHCFLSSGYSILRESVAVDTSLIKL